MNNSSCRDLEKIVSKMEIPHSASLGDAPALDDLKNIDQLINEYSSKYNKKIILYGGQVARSEILGLTNMRKHTSDIEYYCHDENAIRQIISHEPVTYLSKYDIVYIYKKNINITFSYKHIHDLYMPDDFVTSGADFSSQYIETYCANAEYSIMLKMRRIHSLTQKGLDPFGKDALDIISLLTAGNYKPEIKEVYLDKLVYYLVKYVTSQKEKLLSIYKFIDKYKRQLPKKYINGYDKVSADLYSKLIIREQL
jgi:hypothetical protein